MSDARTPEGQLMTLLNKLIDVAFDCGEAKDALTPEYNELLAEEERLKKQILNLFAERA